MERDHDNCVYLLICYGVIWGFCPGTVKNHQKTTLLAQFPGVFKFFAVQGLNTLHH